MYRWSIVVACFLAVLAGTTVYAQKDSAEGGDYLVTGTELDGTEYSGGMEITTNGDSYLVSYQLGTLLYGTGILYNNVFAVASGGPQCLVAVYEPMNDGLGGQWTSQGLETLQRESTVIMSNQDEVLDMALRGSDIDGSAYEGAMTITITGAVTVQVEQRRNETTLQGTGINVNGIYAVVYGNEACSIAAYETRDDGSLVGSWTAMGETRVATESAVPVDIIGQFDVSGVNQDGSRYSGTLDVSADHQVHNFTWVVSGSTLEGIGILRGNIVTAAFGNDQCSVMSYFILPNGTLAGEWAFMGTDASGTELAVIPEGKPARQELDGLYDVSGVNPDSTTYRGELDIVSNADDTYSLTWHFGSNPPVEGVGIRQGNMLLAGYGPRGCGINVFVVSSDEMSGPFVQSGISGTGTETATR